MRSESAAGTRAAIYVAFVAMEGELKMGRYLDIIRKKDLPAPTAKEAKDGPSVSRDSRCVTREPDLTNEVSWEWIEERAAILEFEGGLDRNAANCRAFLMWFERFVGNR